MRSIYLFAKSGELYSCKTKIVTIKLLLQKFAIIQLKIRYKHLQEMLN